MGQRNRPEDLLLVDLRPVEDLLGVHRVVVHRLDLLLGPLVGHLVDLRRGRQ